VFVAYPSDLAVPYFVTHPNKVTSSEAIGVDRLQAAYQQSLTECPQQRFVLAGYSMGAWVIDDWLDQHPSSWDKIAAVRQYGDPGWKHKTKVPGIVDKGLTRMIVDLPEDPAFPSKAHRSQWKTTCLWLDPVCGSGFGAVAQVQLASAAACLGVKCAHYDYVTKKAKKGGKWLASKAFR
jgi:hypothetical protein